MIGFSKVLTLIVFFALNPLLSFGQVSELEQNLEEAIALRKNNQYDDAIPLLESVIQRANKKGDAITMATAMQHQGWCLFFMNQFDKARTLLTQDLDSLQSVFKDNPIEIANFYYCLGAVETRSDQIEASITYLGKAIGIAQEVGNQGALAKFYNALGISYSEKNDLQKALDAYQLSLSLKEELFGETSLEVAKTLNNIGVVYRAIPNLDKALSYYEQSLAIKLDLLGEFNPRVSDTYNNMAATYRDLGNLDLARSYLIKALKIEEAIFGKKSFAVMTKLGVLASVENRRGEYDVALKYVNRCIGILDKIFADSHNLQARNYRLQGEIYVQKGSYINALQSYQNALQELIPSFSPATIYENPILRDVWIKNDLVEAFKGKAFTLLKLYKEEGRLELLENALENFQLGSNASDLLSSSFQDENSQLFLQSDSKDFFEGAMEAAYILYEVSKDPKYIEIAFTYSQKGKQSVLRRLLNSKSKAIIASIPDSIQVRENQLNRAYEQIQSDIQAAKVEQSDSLSFLLKKKIEVSREKELWVQHLKETYPQYYKQKYDVQMYSIEEVQSKLSSNNTLLLDFFVASDKIYRIQIAKDTFQWDQVVFDDGVEDRFMRYSSMIRDQKEADRQSNGEAFFEEFIKLSNEVFNNLFDNKMLVKKDKLILIPDGILYQIPMDLLVSSNKRTSSVDYTRLPYLFTELSINYQYSVQALMESTSSGKNLVNTAIFVPTYQAKGSPTPLAFAQEEAQIVQKYSSGDIYSDSLGLKTQFLEKSRHYGLLHLSMHASYEDEDAMESSLFFGSTTSDILRAYELYSLDLSEVEMIVVSACQTGKGKIFEGEGLIGLSRGLQIAGASSLLLSLWKADDQNTKILMDYFYSYLKQGFAKDKALQKAKLALLESKPLQQFPIYWGPFIQVGDPSPIQMKSASNGFFYLLALLLLLLTLLIGFRKVSSLRSSN